MDSGRALPEPAHRRSSRASSRWGTRGGGPGFPLPRWLCGQEKAHLLAGSVPSSVKERLGGARCPAGPPPTRSEHPGVWGGSDLLRAPETGLFLGRTDRRLPRPSRHPETQLLSDASVQSGTKGERGRTGGAHGSPEPRGGTGQALASVLRGQWPILSGTQFQVPPRGCLVPCVSLGPAGLQKEAFGGEAARLRTALCSVAVGQGKFQRDVQVACGPG